MVEACGVILGISSQLHAQQRHVTPAMVETLPPQKLASDTHEGFTLFSQRASC